MHASSLENMQSCHDRFVANSELASRDRVSVLDVGGSDYNGSYREVFAHPRFAYTAADLSDGPGVHLVLQDSYRLPLDDRSVDIVISGQMLEHCEFFWLTFAEMVRVLRPGGFLFLIAPSAGPEHRYPVDCYRFYPDAFRALARHANCAVVDIWLDERGPWRDLVGVFQRHGEPACADPMPERVAIAPADIVPASAEEERIQGVIPYLDVLTQLHAALAPQCYLEIGIRHGRSLELARGPARGIDPAPEIDRPLGTQTLVARQTSDAYFADPAVALPGPPDFALIDGLHLAEAALRDFMNIERRAAPGAVVVIDDVLPNHPAQATRDRRTRVWTGDVWKLVPLLRQYRPDLAIAVLDTAPSGLLVIAGLDPENRALWQAYNPIVRELRVDAHPPADVIARHGAITPTGPQWAEFLIGLSTSAGSESARANDVRRLAVASLQGHHA